MTDKTNPESVTTLLMKIAAKRGELAAYLGRMEPRSARLTNIAIICGAISAALTAPPALGGESLTAWLTATFGLTLPIWQFLCFGAMACSVVATIVTNMSKSHETTARVMQAQACDAKLEGLETLLQVGTIDADSASEQFVHAIKDVPFI
jgi:hypothetical protein